MTTAATVARSAAALLAFLIFVLAAAPVRGELPGAKDADAYTWHTYAKERLEWNRRTMVQAYETVGKRDPKWDADAVAFLDALARSFSALDVGEFYRPTEFASREQCLALGKAATDAGCDDPLVLYCYARVQELLQRPAEDFAALYGRAYAGAQGRAYPPERIVAMAERAAEHAEPGKQAPLYRVRKEQVLKSASGPFTNRAHRRAVLRSIFEEFPADMPIVGPQHYDEVKDAKGLDPWIVNVYRGHCHIEAGWRARGSGFANTVTPEGWRAFGEQLAEAEKFLTAAWKLHPDLPEAPTLMISVALGQGDRESGTARDWFERAVRAQFDYTEAYNRFTAPLLPRWGGSHEAMLELGLECARTERYDTEVPFRLVQMLDNIRRDTGDWSLWKLPEAYDAATRVLTQYAITYDGRPVAAWYASYHAALAWRLEKYAESRAVLEGLGGKAQVGRFTEFGGSRFSIGEVYARAGRSAADVAKAAEMVTDGDLNGALVLFRAVDAKTPAGDKSKLYLKDRITSLDRRLRFDGGEWVDLLPADDDLVGFSAGDGKWRVEGGGDADADAKRRLVGTSAPGAEMSLYSDFDPGPRYELSVTLARADDPAERMEAAEIKFNFDRANRSEHLTVVVHHEANYAGVRANVQRVGIEQGNIPDPVTVVVRSYDGTSEVTVQGAAKPIRHWRTGKEFRKLTAWASAVASFGELPQGKRGTLYVTGWKVRRLDESPFNE